MHIDDLNHRSWTSSLGQAALVFFQDWSLCAHADLLVYVQSHSFELFCFLSLGMVRKNIACHGLVMLAPALSFSAALHDADVT